MRIFNVYFQACLFVVLCITTSSLFGNDLITNSTNKFELPTSLMLPDTTCGLTDTVIQMSFPTCVGDTNATAVIQLEGDSGPVVIRWDNGATGAMGTNLSPGKHIVTVTNLDGCMLIDSIIIADKPPLVYTITANDALCVGVANGSIEISDTSSLSYRWSTGDSTNMLSGLASGIYTVTITDTLDCPTIETVTINNSTQASLALTGTDATCFGINNGTTVVNDMVMDSGYSYLWSTGDTSKSLMNLSPATYFVLVTSPEGCLNADSINILAERAVDLNPTAVNATCNGVNDGSIIINEGMDVTGFQFGWNTGDTTQMISSLAAGVYSVAIADTTGCISNTAITISNTRQLSFSSNPTDATCEVASNGSIAISSTTDISTYTFNWSTGDSAQTINNLSNGAYTLTITDTLGCSANDSINIGITPDLSITSTVTNATCNGVNDGAITINEGSDLSNVAINWNTGGRTQMLSGLSAGNYSVTLRDSFGCTASDSVEINIGMTFSAIATVTNATCDGINDGIITLNDTTDTQGLSYVWSNGDSTQTINGLAAGAYSYTVTDTLGCIETGMVTVGNTRNVPFNINRTDVTCDGLDDGAITINEGEDITGLTFNWNTGDTTQTIRNIGVGSYSISVADSLGCSVTSIINITTLNTLNVNLTKTNVSCSGLTDGSITIDEGNDLTGFTISWNTGENSQSLTNLSEGRYSAMVTDTLGCMTIDSIEITADSSLQIGLTGNNIDCVGENTGRITVSAIDLTSQEGLSFSWETGDTTATISNLAIGNYEVTVTDNTGCFGTAGATLEQGDTIKINFVVSDVACMDTVGSGAILAVATGGAGNFGYSWSTGDNTTAIGNLLAGTYALTVTDSLGCILTDSVTLVDPPLLIVTASNVQDATCEGTQDGRATVSASGGTNPYAIQWSNGIIAPTINNLNPGSYTVTVTDNAGCEIIDTATIGQVTEIDLILSEISGASSQNDTDAIATATATGGLAPYTFNWDNSAVGDTVNNLSAGSHTVVATDVNGCTTTDSLNISFFELQMSIIDTRNLRCNGDNRGRATAAPLSGTAPFEYLWSTGDTTPTLTTLPAGMHAVTVTDTEGKKGRATVSLTQPNPIYFNLEIIPPGCPNSGNGRITINATNAVGNPLYDFGIGITPNPFIIGITAGTKTFGIIDGNNCRADTTFTIEALAPNPPTAAFNSTSLGLVATFTDQSLNDPTSYLWKFGDGITSDQASPIHQYPDTGAYEVCLITTNPCDVDSICQTIRIQEIPVPGVSLNFGRDTSSLSGQLVSIPVMAGAFEDLAGFSGTFELSNPMIGTIQGVRDFNLPNLDSDNFTVQDNLIFIDWSVADTSNLVSLPNGTPIFTIDLLLTGASNACTQIIATDSEASLLFTKTFMGALVPAPFTINSAEICIAATVSIAGNISTEESRNIAGVTVTTNGDVTSTTIMDGNYALPGLPGGATFNIGASKSDEILLGVTTFDVVRILQHILTQQPLTSPYKVIAADIDNSGIVSSLDLVQLQRLILQQIEAFPNNQPWRFVPENYVFTNPASPLTENFPESIELSRLEIDTANIDFVAIKTGDVVSNANAENARFLPKSMSLEIENQSFRKGDLISIPFDIENINNALGFQLALDFDPTIVAFKGAGKNSYLPLTASNFGQKDIENGHLKMLWINQQQLPIRQLSNGLFQLEFRALVDGNLSMAIQLNTDRFPAQFYTKQTEKIGVQNIDLVINNAKIETTPTNEPTTAFLMMGENVSAGGCGDDLDNDGDGLVDCEDADCFCECNTMEQDSANLIINPNAELNLSSGGWQMIQGDWTTRGFNPVPQDGAAYFSPTDSETGQLTQVIDLSADSAAIAEGLVTYIFTGYVRSFDQEPSDETQVLIEYRNAADSIVSNYDSGLITSLTDWQLIGDTTLAPASAKTVIINLIARRKNGDNNDAFFDNLSLTKIMNDACEAPCEFVDLFTLATFATSNGMDGTATTSLVGGIGKETYNWSTGDTTAAIMDLSPGIYTITVTDSIGCTAMDSIEIALSMDSTGMNMDSTGMNMDSTGMNMDSTGMN
ncbi:MAG: PKD domain-containing protein, partial [Saprospiraceae bacterium]